jgi:hypothetical protein
MLILRCQRRHVLVALNMWPPRHLVGGGQAGGHAGGWVGLVGERAAKAAGSHVGRAAASARRWLLLAAAQPPAAPGPLPPRPGPPRPGLAGACGLPAPRSGALPMPGRSLDPEHHSHVAEGTLAGAVRATAGHAGDAGHGAASAPRLSRGLGGGGGRGGPSAMVHPSRRARGSCSGRCCYCQLLRRAGAARRD